MITFQTIFIYLGLTFILFLSAKTSIKKKSYAPLFWGLFFYSVIFGLRYGVGTDYFSYLNSYLSPSSDLGFREAERGFYLFTRFFADLDMPFTVYFGVIAFLQISLIFYSERPNKFIYPFLALTFMLECVWLSYANIMRQSLAFSFFAVALSFAERKKIVLHYVFILLAISIHMSAVYLILIYPIYILVRKRGHGFLGTKIQLILFVVAVFLGNDLFIGKYIYQIDDFTALVGYDSYTTSADMHEFLLKSEETRLGIGYYLSLLVHILLISYGNKICDYYKNERLSFIYKLFFVGSVLSYLFASSMMLTRSIMYLHGFGFIIGAYVLYYLKKSARKVQIILLLSLYCLIFSGIMYRMYDNDSAYYFIWQSEMVPKSKMY